MPDDRVEEEVPARLRRVPAERLRPRHLVHRLVHRADHRGGQWLRHVADAQADELRIGMRRLELPYAPASLAEEVAGAELQVVVVDSRHGARF